MNKLNKTILHPDEQEIDSWMRVQSESREQQPLLSDGTSHAPVLRPQTFDDYIGQPLLKSNLELACEAAHVRGESLDHVLLHGPPGLGKTSMAQLIASKMNTGFKTSAGPVIEKPGDLAAILSSLGSGDVLFIDEIHRLPRVVEEVLYPAMEDFQIDILIGQGPSAKSVRIELKPFTLVGATTRTGLLTSPLRDRFGMVLRLEFYTPEELADIVTRSARILQLPIQREAALEIGRRARGTPRIANRLLKRVRDYSQVKRVSEIRLEEANQALKRLDIDSNGLDAMDRCILDAIVQKFSGGPVGIDTLAAAIGEEKETLEDVYEPYLLQIGFLARTRRGREITSLGFEHLGIKDPRTQ